MNLLVDESVDRQIADRLGREGHDVEYITEIAPGTSDDTILRRADGISPRPGQR